MAEQLQHEKADQSTDEPTCHCEPRIPEAFGRGDEPRHGSNGADKKQNQDEGKSEEDNKKGEESNQPQKPPFYKRLVPMLILGSILLLAVIIGVVWWLYARHYESTDDAFIDGHIVQISPKVAAIVSAVHLDDNWHVKKDDLLIELDPRDFQVVVDQRTADLATARDKLNQARAELVAAQADVVQLQAELAMTQLTSDNTTRDYERYHGLKIEARSQQQMDNAVTAKDTGDAQVAQAKAKLAASYASEAEADAALKVAESTLARSSADLRQAQINLNYCDIYAPATGLITQKQVEPGDYVEVGQPLFSIVPTDVWVTANYKETQLALMRPGEPVTIEVDAYPHHKFNGRVDSIQNGTGSKFTLLPPENATGNYVKIVQRVPVKIRFDAGETDHLDFLLAPGMSVVPWVKVR
jgi:membrane fusion protein (multidrug efflux system)